MVASRHVHPGVALRIMVPLYRFREGWQVFFWCVGVAGRLHVHPPLFDGAIIHTPDGLATIFDPLFVDTTGSVSPSKNTWFPPVFCGRDTTGSVSAGVV
jgi:hypothetical protein